MSNTKERLIRSALMLLVCVSLFIGSTFAWFTDNVSSSNNVIVSGNLDVDMYWTDKLVGDDTEWYSVDSENGSVFSSNNWEPGYTEVKYLKVVNKGNLAFKYELSLLSLGEIGLLADVVDVYSTQLENGATVSPYDNRAKITGMMNYGVLKDAVSTSKTVSEGILLPKKANDNNYNCGETIIAIALQMKTDAGNKYQNQSIGDGFTIQALATQFDYEKDSFGNDYDKEAFFPKTYLPINISKGINGLVKNGVLTEEIVINAPYGISVTIPAGVKVNNDLSLTLSITEKQNSNANVKLEKNDELKAFDVHVEGIAKDNTVPMIINMGKVLPEGLNKGNLSLYHVEDNSTKVMQEVNTYADLVKHNQFTYEPSTGELTVSMATFSEVTVLADTTKAWEGNYDYSWYDASKTELTIANADQLAAFSAIVGGMDGQTKDSFAYKIDDKTVSKIVKLISDINLGDKESENNPDLIFYPIGYYNSAKSYEKTSGGSITSSVSSFEGIFDGNGHTVSNFYQNTWEMFGDYNSGYSGTPNHYKDAMGLFGYVVNGTVKNLTVDNFSSDGEYTPTGVIAAYADGNSTFENIAITNCNPRVYNTGNGGIIGIAGDTSAANDDHITLKNITVDNSNKISALWGSWDVACGGLVGMYRGNVDGSGNATGDTISFENCHVSAIIDVYNDVCANYQYYAYRYSGMIIGSVRHNTKNGEGKTIPNMTGISAKGCTVNYGDWNDYYYCEFEKNTMASYSEDYQFSRVPHSELNFTDSNGNGVVDADERASVTGCKHTHTAEENHQAIYLPFHQLFTGYSWGVSSIGLEKYNGIVTDLGITEGDQEVSVDKFESKFTNKSFLYRVGNQNTVSLGSLFEAKEGVTISNSGVVASIESLDKDSNVSGTFTANTTDWTKGTIQFKGTGPVKIIIQDYSFCKTTTLYVEVVDGRNYESKSISSLGSGNVVLLCNTKLNNNGSLALQNATLYGNGFELDVTSGRVTGESITANYLLYLNNGHIDNVRIKGAVYTEYGALSSGNYNNPVVLSIGNSKISNSYISNCASPVRVRSGNVVIENTTLKGGIFANLDIRGGNITLDNVTTINQLDLNDKPSDNSNIVGLGVVVYYEGPSSDTTLTIKRDLKQFNSISSETKLNNEYAQGLINEMFKDDYKDYHYEDSNGTKWVNTGIVSMSNEVRKDNININEQTNSGKYQGRDIKYNVPLQGESEGYLYSRTQHSPEKEENSNFIQDNVIPKVSFDHTVNEKIKEEGSETSCTFDPLTDKETITFANGESFNWNVNILKCSNKDIEYTVWKDNVQYKESIVFDESGVHTIVFKYTDKNNYRINKDGQIEKFTINYEKTMEIKVVEQDKTALNAEITFPLLESYGTTKVTVDGKTYIMPNLTGTNVPKYGDDLTFDASTRNYGSLKSDGKANVDIYYPIIKTQISGNYMVFPVFGNKNGVLVHIQDYADKGLGSKLTPYDINTQSLPSGLSVSRGYTVQWSTDKEIVGSGSMSYGSWTDGLLAFKYQSSSDDIACKVMSNYLSYYPNINLRSNDRNEQVMVAEYKYVDNKGDTFYYCVGYHIEERNSGYAFGEKVPESSGGGCVAKGTLVTLADGTKKPVEDVTASDQLLVWDFFNGKYTTVPATVIVNHGNDVWNVISLMFSDGTKVDAVTAHAFFDMDLNKFVLFDDKNVSDYIGHKFMKADGNSYTEVELVDYKVEKRYTGSYSLVSAKHYNFIVEDMISLTNSVSNLLAGLEVGENMKYDQKTLIRDIMKYGVYDYKDFSDYVTEEQFMAFNGPFLKISVGKGYITYEEIVDLILRFVNPNH